MKFKTMADFQELVGCGNVPKVTVERGLCRDINLEQRNAILSTLLNSKDVKIRAC